ncbi:MAG: hypothetical protein ACOYXT_09660 [Bacteroidota bacterium]
MSVSITIFKSELVGKSKLEHQILQLCKAVQALEDTYVYTPMSGKVVEFLHLLRDNKIMYSSHFETPENMS